jgi:gluconate 2-dehydrogenase gamma chain
MPDQDTYSRRHFVALALFGAGGICLLSRCGSHTSSWRFFTDAEARVMDALADQIIPPDEWPGGSDSGVTNFIDKQLTGPYVRFRQKYRTGLAAVQETCLKSFQKQFEDLTWDEQTSFLETLENGSIEGPPWEGGFGQEFFNLIRDHSMQAFYGSPRHGGNKGYISYKMLALDYPHIIGQNRYNL